MKGIRKFIAFSVLSLIGICIISLAVFAISNRTLPKRSSVVRTLSEEDKVRLAEFLHIRTQLSNAVFPGWGEADIPVIHYNEEYAFLIGYPDPPDGWIKIPAEIKRGSAWEPVAGDSFMGQTYYRQRLHDPGITPEAFTVKVGDRWASSLPTLDWMKINLIQAIQQDLPSFLRPVFPYRLFLSQLLSSDDQYISLNAHESFHAYQGLTAPGKLAAAENANQQFESQYPWGDTALQTDWQAELELLAEAVQTTDPAESMDFARRFLELRKNRRSSAGLSAGLIAYEQKREWLEGLARYAELEIWRQASMGGYLPIPESESLRNFRQYAGFENRWRRELDQFSRMAGDEGDGRFYYTGMAQAYLLDRLAPDWKTSAFDENIWLEDLLQAVIQIDKN